MFHFFCYQEFPNSLCHLNLQYSMFITRTVFEKDHIRQTIHGNLDGLEDGEDVDNKIAIINGTKNLTGAQVCATDLRAGAALVIAGLAAQGQTEIDNVKYIDRGYEQIEEKFRMLGADIKRVDD